MTTGSTGGRLLDRCAPRKVGPARHGRGVRREARIEPDRSEQLAALWVAAHRMLAAFVGTLLPHTDDADEVLQRVAVTIVRKFDAYDPNQPFTAWAIGIAKFEVKAFRRQRGAAKVVVWDDDLLDRITRSYQRLSSRSSSLQDALGECLERLDERSRKLLDMRYADDVKPAGIAGRLGVSSGAVRTALSKVRLALRNCVERRLASQARGAS